MTLRLPIYPTARDGFHQGMVRDEASHVAPQGSWWTAQDALCDVPGKIRRRGGIDAIGSGSPAADGSQHLAVYDAGIETLSPLLVGVGTPASAGNQPGRVRVWNTTTGAGTDIDGTGVATNQGSYPSSLKAFLGPPTLHRGVLCAASAASREYDMVFWSGSQAKAGTTYSGGGFQVTVTPDGRGLRTGGATDFTTLSEIGHIVTIFGVDAASTNCIYIGRLTSVGATEIALDPAPPTTIVGSIMTTIRCPGFIDTTTPAMSQARSHLVGHYLLSHQGRQLIGAPVLATYSGGWSGIRPCFSRRFYWSNTKDESPSLGYKVYGLVFMAALGYEYASWDELPGTDPMTGWVKTSDTEVLIFTRYRTYALTGELQSITQEVGQKTWQTSLLWDSTGCSQQNVIQQTPYGPVWADDQGVYLYAGGAPRHLLAGGKERWWQRRVKDALAVNPSAYALSPTPYLGSAYYAGHYFLSLRGASDPSFDTTLVVNVTTGAVTTWTLPFQGSSRDPVVPNKTWAMHYWRPSGGFSLTGGSMVELSTGFADASLGDTVFATDSSSASTPHLVLVSNTWSEGNHLPMHVASLILRYSGPSSSGVAGSVYAYEGLDVRTPEAAGWGSAVATLPANPGVAAYALIGYRRNSLGLSLKIDVPAGGTRFELDRVEYEYQLGTHYTP